MPPKVKITKEEIINAAVEIVRKEGAQSINARTIAAALNCSTQPVFSNFATMEELRQAVMVHAYNLSQEYMQNEIACGNYPIYKSSGMAYIRFAKEEKELFKLLFMCERTKEQYHKEIRFDDNISRIVESSTGLDNSNAQLFHLEMWAIVHGIATMFVTGFLDLDWDLVSKMLTDSYMGLRKQYGTE
jgi:AcrR family transcriptional regulator